MVACFNRVFKFPVNLLVGRRVLNLIFLDVGDATDLDFLIVIIIYWPLYV